MVIYVLDSSAVLRFLDGEAGFEVVREIFRLALRGECILLISAVNWGEVAGKLYQRVGSAAAEKTAARILRKGLKIVPVSAERAAASAILSVDLGIGYADAFGVELATDPNSMLVTADYGVKRAEELIRIEFLPTKPKP